jgi:hypothetical protein
MDKPVLTNFQKRVLNAVPKFSSISIYQLTREIQHSYYFRYWNPSLKDHGHVLRAVRALRKKDIIRVIGLLPSSNPSGMSIHSYHHVEHT